MFAHKVLTTEESIPPEIPTTKALGLYEEESQLVGMCDGMYILTPTDDSIGVKTGVTVLGVWRIDG